MQQLEATLAEQPFFKGLAPRYVRLIAECSSNVRFESGQYIFREGEEATHFYVIRHGMVSVEVSVPGREPRIIQTIHADEALGWSWLLPPYTWRFDARALELTRAIAFDSRCVREKCEADHEMGYEVLKHVLQVVSQRLQATRLQLLDVYGNAPSR